jgi:hypothetical protein
MGRFLTPDPYVATTGSVNNPAEPQSWNRYAYVLNDSVNLHDPQGLQAEGPSYDPYEGLLSLILHRLREPFYENGEPERLAGIPDLLQDSTRWGRDWAVQGLQYVNRNCGGQLKQNIPGQNFTIGQRLAEVAETITVVQTWDPVQMNATFGELFGGNVSQTMREWIIETIGMDWRHPLTRWSGAIAGNVLIITENGASSIKNQMATLVHELLHGAFSGADHTRIANALGLYSGEIGYDAATNNALSNDSINSWIAKCIGDVR